MLSELASVSGGEQRTDVTSVYADPPRSSKRVSLLPWLFVASVVVLVLEIGGRRLNLWDRTDERFTRTARASERPAPRPQSPRERRRAAAEATSAADSVVPDPAPATAATMDPPVETVDVFRRAKSRAKRRLK